MGGGGPKGQLLLRPPASPSRRGSNFIKSAVAVARRPATAGGRRRCPGAGELEWAGRALRGRLAAAAAAADVAL